MAESTQLAEARRSLAGLAIGDCFGERFFVNPAVAQTMVEERALAAAPWPYTDDTDMAVAIVFVLEKHGRLTPLADAILRRSGGPGVVPTWEVRHNPGPFGATSSSPRG